VHRLCPPTRLTEIVAFRTISSRWPSGRLRLTNAHPKEQGRPFRRLRLPIACALPTMIIEHQGRIALTDATIALQGP
jgi:hypothetical protein